MIDLHKIDIEIGNLVPIELPKKLSELISIHSSDTSSEEVRAFFIPSSNVVHVHNVPLSREFQEEVLSILELTGKQTHAFMSEDEHSKVKYNPKIGDHGLVDYCGISWLTVSAQAFVDYFDGKINGFTKSVRQPSFAERVGSTIDWLKNALRENPPKEQEITR